jgi:hypothetical protein
MSQRADGDESIHLTDGLIREKADASLQNCFSTHISRFVSLFFLTVDTSGSLLFVGFPHPPSLFRRRDVNPLTLVTLFRDQAQNPHHSFCTYR